MNVPPWGWLAVLAGIAVMLAVDLFAHRRANVIGIREAAGWSAFWAAARGGVRRPDLAGLRRGVRRPVLLRLRDREVAVGGQRVHLALIFSYFAVPREYQHRVLFYGVVGALVFRGAFIAAGSALLASFAWVIYLFGAFLIFTGLKMLRSATSKSTSATATCCAGSARGCRIPTTSEAPILGAGGWGWLATPLFAVLLMIEFTDIIFAVDSIPAIFAVTQEPFLVFTANAFAILGLRALYFLLADLIARFVYLSTGLALVLVWVGTKMMLHIWDIKVPTLISLAVVILIIASSVVWSLYATRGSSDSTGSSSRAADEPAVDAEWGDDAVDSEVSSTTPGA